VGVGPNPNFGDRLASAAASGVISYGVQRAVGIKAKVDYTTITANAIGQSLVEELAAGNQGSRNLVGAQPDRVLDATTGIAFDPNSPQEIFAADRHVEPRSIYYDEAAEGEYVQTRGGRLLSPAQEKEIGLKNGFALYQYGNSVRETAGQVIVDDSLVDAYLMGDKDLHRAARTTQAELIGFETQDEVKGFLAGRLNETADNVDLALGRMGNLMRTQGSLQAEAPRDPGAYMLLRGVDESDLARLGKTSLAGDIVGMFAPVMGPAMRGAALQNDQKIAQTLFDVGAIDKDTYGALSSGIQSAADRQKLMLTVGAGLLAVGGLVGGAVSIYERFAFAANTNNKILSIAREERVAAELAGMYPNASIQSERYLHTIEGMRALDPLTGTGRRIDHVVVENGLAIDAVETTSLTATKAAQIAKENRIRQLGGTFIRDQETGALVDLSNVPTRIVRKP